MPPVAARAGRALDDKVVRRRDAAPATVVVGWRAGLARVCARRAHGRRRPRRRRVARERQPRIVAHVLRTASALPAALAQRVRRVILPNTAARVQAAARRALVGGARGRRSQPVALRAGQVRAKVAEGGGVAAGNGEGGDGRVEAEVAECVAPAKIKGLARARKNSRR